MAQQRESGYSPREVGRHYDEHAEAYLRTYGDTIQACRTRNLEDLHRRTILRANLLPGQVVLDAGCGFGGPAIFFARALDLTIEALTVSSRQHEIATRRVEAAGLADRVHPVLGDYHRLPRLYSSGRFDRILFLESLGHARRLETVLAGALEVLKPGGLVYIKDFFARPGETPARQIRIREIVEQVNLHYRYNVLDESHLFGTIRRCGLEVVDFREPDFESDIGPWVRFEELCSIDLFQGREKVDFGLWFELSLVRPG